ncbi:hypothetical protein INT48_004122 [Thamnidium elegans]|uniref:Uncharacterized protein n=1 Tax=Thamnidium elegans TaxID=101142 RepID=A0A8H7VYU9_9FUNG|nr:hypothetical protein INT48_004122 [Thamnidium elegans]
MPTRASVVTNSAALILIGLVLVTQETTTKLDFMQIEFFFADGINPSIKLVKCTTGGALTIYGTRQNYSAECIDANGVTTTVPIDDVPAP